jgi:multiple sugar transport system substrate-binding protein
MRTARRVALSTTLTGVVAVTGALVAATASSATPKAAAASPVTLNYWDMQWGEAPMMNAIKGNVAAFNKSHPSIQVKFTQLGWGDYTQKILSAVQSGNPPDVSGGDAGLPFSMAAQGQALDISDLYKKWQSSGLLKDMVPWAYQKWAFQGGHPGVTWQFDTRLLIYRKDLFRKAGIAVPKTWAEWLAAAKKLTVPSKKQFGLAFPGKQGSYDADQFYMTLVLQAGGELADANGNPTIDSPQQLKALNFEKQLAECCAAKGTPSWVFDNVLRAYEQGHAAMAFGLGNFLTRIKTEKPDLYKNTGVLPVLIGPGGPKAQHSVAFANAWMVYKGSKHPTEAKVFLDWMMQRKNIAKLYAAEPGGKWPVYRSLINTPTFQSDPLIRQVAQQVTTYSRDYWWPNNKAAIAIGSLGTSLTDIIVNPVLTGTRQPADALKDAQKKLAPLFKQK